VIATLLYSAHTTADAAGLYSEYGYEKRLTVIEAEFPGANILLHKLGKLPQVLYVLLMSFLFHLQDCLKHRLLTSNAVTLLDHVMLVKQLQIIDYCCNSNFHVDLWL